MRLKFLFVVFLLLCGGFAYAESVELDMAIEKARIACGGISEELSDMKKMAGINTAVTGVGTVAGAGATITGVIKSAKDKKTEEQEALIADLEELGAKRISTQEELLTVLADAFAEVGDEESMQMALAIRAKKSKLEQQSKRLGNWRTGLLTANTATNVAGSIIAGTNRVGDDLYTKIDLCIDSVKELANIQMQAYVSGELDVTQNDKAQKIVNACRDWEFVDLSSVDNRARGATISSGIGAGVGFVGTIVSAVSNTKKIRNSDTDAGKKKEKNLNTTANVMAGGATVASGVATVFNATQINAIKQAVDVADKCEKAL